MWRPVAFYQQSCPHGNVQSNNNMVNNSQNATVIIDENQNHQNLLPDSQYYDNNFHDARSSAAHYIPVPPLAPLAPPSSPIFPFLMVTAPSTINFDTIHDAYIQVMNEKYQSDLRRLKIDVIYCKELLAKQLEINALLLGHYFRG